MRSDLTDALYSMELHEKYTDSDKGIEITRVPGGWLYFYLFRKDTIFIAYNDEFDYSVKEANHARQIAQRRAIVVAQPQVWDTMSGMSSLSCST